MNGLLTEAFIAFIEMPEDRKNRRDGQERRLKDVGAMDEKRSGEDRRQGFRGTNKASYYCKMLEGVFDEYMHDHEFNLPIGIITDGKKVIGGPIGILNDWLGYDFQIKDLDSVYVDQAVRSKILARTKDFEFSRYFPHITKANGKTIVLDILITSKPNPSGDKWYYCFVSMAD